MGLYHKASYCRNLFRSVINLWVSNRQSKVTDSDKISSYGIIETLITT